MVVIQTSILTDTTFHKTCFHILGGHQGCCMCKQCWICKQVSYDCSETCLWASFCGGGWGLRPQLAGSVVWVCGWAGDWHGTCPYVHPANGIGSCLLKWVTMKWNQALLLGLSSRWRSQYGNSGYYLGPWLFIPDGWFGWYTNGSAVAGGWRLVVCGVRLELGIILAWCTFLSVPGRNLCRFSLFKELYNKELCMTANICFLDSQADLWALEASRITL